MSAKKALDGLQREVIGGEAIGALEGRKPISSMRLPNSTPRAYKRRAETEDQAKRLEEQKETGQSGISMAEKKLELKNQEIETKREKKLAALRKNLNELNASISGIKTRSGNAYRSIFEWTRKRVMDNSGKDSAWLDQLLQILDSAEGTDSRVDLNGAYDFKNVPFGNYIVYVSHRYRRNKLLWLAPWR